MKEDGRLQVGDVFKQSGTGTEMVVWYVNESRACIVPLANKIMWRKRDEDGKIQFLVRDSESISPNSEVELLRELGRQGLADYLDQRKENNEQQGTTDMKKDKKEKKAKQKGEQKPRLGMLGGWKGYSITSYLRALGAAGWTLAEMRAFVAREGIPAKPNTVKMQHRYGRLKIQPGAPIDVGALKKPKVEMKATKTAKPDAKPTKKGKGKVADKLLNATKLAKKAAKAAKKGKPAKVTKSAKPSKKAKAPKAPEPDEEIEQAIEEGGEEEAA